ncbi:serine/threonine protein kinase [Phytophthora cinnamomi]|uniref:serine/threonine protein kinase n=1 Tax=Phytophthora cinnamomi TaxID=4785 RepID=UPI003559DD69|nr:serine/threonine protein kinase [Phytophthora cinnamomi]
MRLCRQVTLGLHFLHSNGIAHRDVSLENVLLRGGVCKLSDFGLATDAERMCAEVVGKANYMAPEVVAGEAYAPVAADMWSLGIVLFIMLTGSPLWYARVPAEQEFTSTFSTGAASRSTAMIRGQYAVQSRLHETLFGGTQLYQDLSDDNGLVAVKQIHIAFAKHALERNLQVGNPSTESCVIDVLHSVGPHENVL